MRLLLVAAEPREFAGLVRRWEAPVPVPLDARWARRGRLNGHDMLVVANGAGRARAGAAVAAACAVFHPEAVVSTGLCGALDPAAGIADLVVGSAVTDGARSYAAAAMAEERGAGCGHRVHHGTVYTLDHVAQTAAEKAVLRKSGAVAVEMEASGVAEEAARRGLPFFCVRAVSDLAGESFANDLNAALREDGHFDTMHILKNCWREPMVRVPELLRLRSRSIRAAHALGDFFADCRF